MQRVTSWGSFAYAAPAAQDDKSRPAPAPDGPRIPCEANPRSSGHGREAIAIKLSFVRLSVVDP